VKKILPFHPTNAQKRVLKEIVEDLKAPQSHDVACFRAMWEAGRPSSLRSVVVAVENGYQGGDHGSDRDSRGASILNAKRVPRSLGYRIGVLRRGLKKAEKKKLFEDLAAVTFKSSSARMSF
jgi:ATP-dependent DNA helicase RecG